MSTRSITRSTIGPTASSVHDTGTTPSFETRRPAAESLALDLDDVRRLQALGTLGRLELDLRTLGESLEAVADDAREMYEEMRKRFPQRRPNEPDKKSEKKEPDKAKP